MTPTFSAYIRPHTNPDPEASLVAPRAPRPTGAPCDGEVVPPETKPGRRNANQTTEDEVETKVTEVCKARATHVNSGADGNEDENERVNGRSSGLVAVRNDSIVSVRGTGKG